MLDQAKGLGSQLEAYEQKGEALRAKTETMQGFLDFANKLKPTDSQGTFDGKALSDEAGRISQKTGYNPLDLVGMHQMALKGDLSASEGDQIIEALSGHIETLGSQNETVQTHLKRIYESRNECYSFVSAMLQSVGRNMSSVAQSISFYLKRAGKAERPSTMAEQETKKGASGRRGPRAGRCLPRA